MRMTRQLFFIHKIADLLRRGCFFLLLAGCFFLTGCQGFSATGGPGPLVKNDLRTWRAPTFSPQTINQIVVMPLEGEVYQGLPESVQRQIARELGKTFELNTSLEVIAAGETMDAQARGPQSLRAARLGEAAGVQGVLYGVLTRYRIQNNLREQRGRPSAAGFKLWLVKSGHPEPLWSASYEKEEQPLSENLFLLPEALERGVGFKGSMVLLKRGFTDAADALQQLRR